MGLVFKDDFHDEFGTWPIAYIPYGGADLGEVPIRDRHQINAAALSGLALLQHAQDRAPHVVRLLLQGASQRLHLPAHRVQLIEQ